MNLHAKFEFAMAEKNEKPVVNFAALQSVEGRGREGRCVFSGSRTFKDNSKSSLYEPATLCEFRFPRCAHFVPTIFECGFLDGSGTFKNR
jgi:hypothetical protein